LPARRPAIPIKPPLPSAPAKLMRPTKPPKPATQGHCPLVGSAASGMAVNTVEIGSSSSFSHQRAMVRVRMRRQPQAIKAAAGTTAANPSACSAKSAR
jgi:hypothetical protein